MATKVNQWLEGFNKVFVVPKRFKYIEDKLHNVKRSESELRILTGLILMPIFLNITLSFLVILISYSVIESSTLKIRERQFDGVAFQKLYLLYTNGHTITLKLNNDFTIKVSRKLKLDYDICSYFGYYDQPYLNIFAGSIKNISKINTNNRDMKILGRHMPSVPYHFEVDSTTVQSGDYFWVIGHECGKEIEIHQTNIMLWHNQFSQTSTMFSKNRKKWIAGPKLPFGLKFTGACGLPLNRTIALFVGVSHLPFFMTNNDMTLTFDFQSRKWKYQESIPTVTQSVPFYHTTCVLDYGKNSIEARIIAAQIVVIWQEEVLKLWQSSKNQIKWSAINLEGSPKRGNLINWRGQLFYFHQPGPKANFGYHVILNDANAQLQEVTLSGDSIYDESDEKKWLKQLPKVDHAMQKLLILPFY